MPSRIAGIQKQPGQIILSGLDPTWAVSNLQLKLLGYLLSYVCKTPVILILEPKGEM